MARPWRLRHKLQLGLGLVVGSIGLLLYGAAENLSSYVGTINTTDSKLQELAAVLQLKLTLNSLTAPDPSPNARQTEYARIKEKLKEARLRLADFDMRFQETLARKRDPDKGFQEKSLKEDFAVAFTNLEQAVEAALAKHLNGSELLVQDPRVAAALSRLHQLADELVAAIYDDMFKRIDEARRFNRRTFLIVVAASVLAILLLTTLVILFSGWVFTPIKELQAGVQRVANEDFDTPILLSSNDELEELANAFNQMTARLRDIYRDLEQQVNERSKQLVRSERLVSVGFLAAGLAHEINNPLASIVFCSEALERRFAEMLGKLPPEDAATAVKFLRMINQEALRCKDITRRLLEFSRVGEKRREPTDLAELVRGVLEVAQHLPNCHGKRIFFQPLTTVTAAVNATDIKSVVLNLVVNALDSMEDGGTVTLTLGLEAGHAVLTCCDTGCGMTNDVLKHIFEPFYTRSRSGKGTGLGLFISHQIVDDHDGTIEASSAGPGRGSTFRVALPLVPRRSIVTKEVTNDTEDAWQEGDAVRQHMGDQSGVLRDLNRRGRTDRPAVPTLPLPPTGRTIQTQREAGSGNAA